MAKDKVEIELSIEEVLSNIEGMNPREEKVSEVEVLEEIVEAQASEDKNEFEDEMTRFFDEPIMSQTPSQDGSQSEVPLTSFDSFVQDVQPIFPQIESSSAITSDELEGQLERLVEEVTTNSQTPNLEKQLSSLQSFNQGDEACNEELIDGYEMYEDSSVNSLYEESTVENDSSSAPNTNPAGNVDMDLWEELVSHESEMKRGGDLISNGHEGVPLFFSNIIEEMPQSDFSSFLDETSYSEEDSTELLGQFISEYNNQIADGENESLLERPLLSKALDKSARNVYNSSFEVHDQEDIEDDALGDEPIKTKKSWFPFFHSRLKVVEPTVEPNLPKDRTFDFTPPNSFTSYEDEENSEAIEEEYDSVKAVEMDSRDFLNSLEQQMTYDDPDNPERGNDMQKELFDQFLSDGIELENDSEEYVFSEEPSSSTIDDFEGFDIHNDLLTEDEEALFSEDENPDYDANDFVDMHSFDSNYFNDSTSEERMTNIEAVDEFDSDEEEFQQFSISSSSSFTNDQSVEYAGILSRGIAFLIDNLVIIALQLMIVNGLLERVFDLSPDFSIISIQHVTKVIIYLLYFVLFTKLTDGQTLGKMICGIQVVCLQEQRLSWTTVILREGCMRFVLSTSILILGYLAVLFTKTQQPADILCSTNVIKSASLFEFYDTLDSAES